jgi:hypothetical protein
MILFLATFLAYWNIFVGLFVIDNERRVWKSLWAKALARALPFG